MKVLKFLGKNDLSEYLSNLSQNAVVIYSPTAMAHLDINSINAQLISYKDYNNDIDQLRGLVNHLGINRIIIGLGGGSAIDAAKYIASQTNSQFVCIPSMLSTNAYSTNKVALNKAGQKMTIAAKLPVEVILDANLLSLNKGKNLLGLADVLSIHTALYDWVISNKYTNEPIDRKMYIKANRLLESTINHILTTSPVNLEQDLDWLYRTVQKSGEITNEFGSGRPESGSEHMFAKALESKLNIHHGVSVSLGIIVCSIMQRNLNEDVVRCIQKLGSLDELRNIGLNRKLVFDTIESLRPRTDRYSILDRVNIPAEYIDSVIDTIEDVAGITLETVRQHKVPDLAPSTV